ncbi:ACP S-malonyltransferase [Paenibacillus sp. chi10]|uniref:[acyl-carrier-protein] S-malonyltransferase n=1 Tax=Paenibacillus suaedae TaxID=3077233 RepID=A0AAJ2JWP6_9BACL|nr:ACP S-malonyltransferase [Paenibacillus sp. chi10]MDT8977361.1 ACP S-malonyltransferase [Paenibacillus sp. chi10]
MITYLFPGQGSQQKGMGKDLFDEFPDMVHAADQILGYSIKELCLEDPENKLGFTQFTQPALFVVNSLLYLKKRLETGQIPDYVAGHSLGEYNALFAANAFNFETGLKLVKKRGELMGKAYGGGMAAVIGLTGDQVREVLDTERLAKIDIANYNSPTQIVISGPKEDIDKAKSVFESNNHVRMYSPLKVSGAFHSRYMENARQEFEKYIDEMPIQQLEISVISNVYARPYTQKSIKTNLIKQITHSVQWTDSIRYLLGRGEMNFEEIGTGKILTGMLNRIKREAEPITEVEEIEVPNFDRSNKLGNVLAIHEEIVVKKPVEEVVQKPFEIIAASLGNKEFKKNYGLKYAYLTGAMYRGVASKELVVKMGKSGMMGFLGTGGMHLAAIEADIQFIQKELSEGQAYGLNFLYNLNNPDKEHQLVDLLLKYKVRTIEASAFLGITSSLVKYKAKGLRRDGNGNVITDNRIIAKISRPEVAEAFLSPAPKRIVDKLLDENVITANEAELLKNVPMANDLSVEADSGGHTDSGVAYALMPAITVLRDEMMSKYRYTTPVRVGAAGGIGTPQAAAAAFVMGADFIVTGSINQCTVEANTHDTVKDLLQQMNVQDTELAPAGDMFEFGAKVQVLKKGLFFPARANKLYHLYCQHNSIVDIDEKTKKQIQEKYFKRSFESVFEELKSYYPHSDIEKAENNPKHKMALIFKWYFAYSTKLALSGNIECKVDYQVHCGPSLGAFNQWVKGTELENWRNRHVDDIALKIMHGSAELLNKRYKEILMNA